MSTSTLSANTESEHRKQPKNGAVAVCMYAAVFVLVNASYIALCMAAVDTASDKVVSGPTKRMMRLRALLTLSIFTTAAVVSLWFPVTGFCIVTLTLLTYLHPSSGN